jgi:hypothetical protein
VNPKPETPRIRTEKNAEGVIELHSTAANGNQWFFQGSLIPGATEKIYIPVAEGNYTVQTTQRECTSDISENYFYSATSVVLVEKNLGNTSMEPIQVIPNPAHDNVQLCIAQSVFLGSSTDEVTVTFFTTQGSEVFSHTFSQAELIGTTSSSQFCVHLMFPQTMRSGIYSVRMQNDKNTVWTQCVIIR